MHNRILSDNSVEPCHQSRSFIIAAQFIGIAVAKPPHPDGFPTTYEWAYAFTP
jgi:hypothetical protein